MIETTITACSLPSQSRTKELRRTSLPTRKNTKKPSSASPYQDEDNDVAFDGDAFSIRSILSGLTELTNDTKGRRRRERERKLPTKSSSTTSIPKTIAFSTTSGRSSKKLDVPLSPSTTTMTIMMTIDEDDTHTNNNSMSKNQIPSSSTTGQTRQEEISSLLLERLLRKETKKSSFSTRRFDLSFQNNNTATQLFPMD